MCNLLTVADEIYGPKSVGVPIPGSTVISRDTETGVFVRVEVLTFVLFFTPAITCVSIREVTVVTCDCSIYLFN